VGSWDDLARFLGSLPPEDLARISRYSGLDLTGGPEAVPAALSSYARAPEATPSILLSTTCSQAAFARDMDLARRIGQAALELAETDEERQLAHISLAQLHFQNRREEEELEAFLEHCREAIRLGHPGTFCYERLAVLYEYRGQLEEAKEVCRRAVEVLEEAGDTRSADRFRKRLERISGKD
jgi:tetratricopeptide (TPR) repeat protein